MSRYSPTAQVWPLAREWEQNNADKPGVKVPQGVYPASAYTPLKNALDDGNYKQAWSEYQNLLAAKQNNPGLVASGLQKSIYEPFTGSGANDQAFYASLKPDQQNIVRAADARRSILWDRFGQMMGDQQASQQMATK